MPPPLPPIHSPSVLAARLRRHGLACHWTRAWWPGHAETRERAGDGPLEVWTVPGPWPWTTSRVDVVATVRVCVRPAPLRPVVWPTVLETNTSAHHRLHAGERDAALLVASLVGGVPTWDLPADELRSGTTPGVAEPGSR